MPPFRSILDPMGGPQLAFNMAIVLDGIPWPNAAHPIRPTPLFYQDFHQETPIWVESAPQASNRLADRNMAGAHIEWDPRYRWTHTANQSQGIYLHNPGFPGNMPDVEVYDHIVYNFCKYEDSVFAFNQMRDLYFFLIHAQRRNAYQWIRHIEILDFTGGTYVYQAIQKLNQCRNLRRITFRYCRRCHETRCRPNVWRALKLFRATPRLRPRRLRFYHRYNQTNFYCDKCQEMGAMPGNTIGAPNPNSASQMQQFNNRIDFLKRTMLG